MLDVHIHDFYKDCASVLLQGFMNFPVAQTLYVEDISGPDEMDEFGLHSRRHQSALGAIIWLRDEGFIRFGVMNRQESVDEFVLTSKAFSRMIIKLEDHNNLPTFEVMQQFRRDCDSLQLSDLIGQHILQIENQ